MMKGISTNEDDPSRSKEKSSETQYKLEIVWSNVFKLAFIHGLALYAFFMLPVSTATVIFVGAYGVFGGMGITAGAHRLWTHKAYKAKLPLKIFLAIAQAAAGQNSIYVWSRDHRVHHKFTETDADPHNAQRGFFFSHVGWLMCKKHPDVFTKGKLVEFGDLEADPVVMFQHKYYYWLLTVFCYIVPIVTPWYFWNEDFFISFVWAGIARYALLLNFTWLVNSAAHTWGWRPYDQSIDARENPVVSFLAIGEGWHNYHHAFPWDYSTSEFGWSLNISTIFIDAMAAIGQAYDLKTAPKEMILKRTQRTGYLAAAASK